VQVRTRARDEQLETQAQRRTCITVVKVPAKEGVDEKVQKHHQQTCEGHEGHVGNKMSQGTAPAPVFVSRTTTEREVVELLSGGVRGGAHTIVLKGCEHIQGQRKADAR
jgi:hypothetical protein